MGWGSTNVREGKIGFAGELKTSAAAILSPVSLLVGYVSNSRAEFAKYIHIDGCEGFTESHSRLYRLFRKGFNE